MAAAHLLERAEQGVVADAEAAEQVADAAGELAHREQQVLGGEVVVAERRAFGVGGFEHPVGLGRELGLLRGLAVDLGDARERVVDPVAQGLGGDADAFQHREHDALGLAGERGEQVLGGDLRMVELAGQGLGGAQRLARLAGQLVGVERHGTPSGHDGTVPKVDNITIKFIPESGPERKRARRRSAGPARDSDSAQDQPVNAGWTATGVTTATPNRLTWAKSLVTVTVFGPALTTTPSVELAAAGA